MHAQVSACNKLACKSKSIFRLNMLQLYTEGVGDMND